MPGGPYAAAWFALMTEPARGTGTAQVPCYLSNRCSAADFRVVPGAAIARTHFLHRMKRSSAILRGDAYGCLGSR
jgi:hypothetical protein